MIIELPKLIAWLETKPADETYEPNSPSDCLLARYLRDNGVINPGVSYDRYHIGDNNYLIPREVEYAATGRTNPSQFEQVRTSTYGEALERALLPVLTGDYHPEDIL